MTALGPSPTDCLENIETPVFILLVHCVLLARLLVRRSRLYHHTFGRLACLCACHTFLERGGSTYRTAFPFLLFKALILLVVVVIVPYVLHRGRNAGMLLSNAPFL
jgi:hypothetical protein